MKLIIDIPEHVYDLIQEEQECSNYEITKDLYMAVYKGVKIVPKTGHWKQISPARISMSVIYAVKMS